MKTLSTKAALAVAAIILLISSFYLVDAAASARAFDKGYAYGQVSECQYLNFEAAMGESTELPCHQQRVDLLISNLD